MIVVALDGAFGGFSVAVVEGQRVRAQRRVNGNVALEQGLPLLVEALREAGLAPGAVDLLAVGIGPGAFTGLRIAVSYAKSLALGWKLPLAGVNSFDALVYGLQPPPDLAAISAKAGTASARLTVAGDPLRFSGT
ncbi:MAG: tRNA (adenosine(37)-N6)-threonylcarbamoyltransferase complex dimerization subunit type 1 TsaB, partial [Candidatus Eremiobacteraeota bacterium]|nr:tRNA (adenosine(37)-N6)-threonylcarbamoyltransferase complex dimerization subunit type 1 TsaB [Candidatus Eremiobacteraeota bacterium]